MKPCNVRIKIPFKWFLTYLDNKQFHRLGNTEDRFLAELLFAMGFRGLFDVLEHSTSQGPPLSAEDSWARVRLHPMPNMDVDVAPKFLRDAYRRENGLKP